MIGVRAIHKVSAEREGNSVACPECGVQVTQLRRHLKKVHPDAKQGAPVPPRKRASRTIEARSGELWARCPECRVPVKDAELFAHLLNCPGAEVRQAEWVAEQAVAAAKAAEAKAVEAKAAEEAAIAAEATPVEATPAEVTVAEANGADANGADAAISDVQP